MAQIKERITKDGKKRFTAYLRVKGYEPLSATFDRKTDATTWSADVESQMRRGLYIKDNQARKHTLAELIDRYIENVLPDREKDQQKVKMQLTWWKDNLGYCVLSDLKPTLIIECRDKLSKEPSTKGKGELIRSGSTVNKYMSSLSVALTKAVNEWEWLDSNPISKVSKKKESRGRTRFLSDKEHKRLLEVCQASSNKYLYLLVIIALSTGARRGEIMNLDWDNVDLNRETPMLYFMATKNGENRAVPITGMALDLIQEYSKVRNIKSNLVFARSDGEKVIDLRWQWEEALRKASIEEFTFHDLRHTAASKLAMNGASLLEIAEILGHKTLAMVQRYAHLTKKHTATILEDMNNKQFAKHQAK